jgi:hypothetical protein
MKSGGVTQGKQAREGEIKGKANTNPLLDTRNYQVEFPDVT